MEQCIFGVLEQSSVEEGWSGIWMSIFHCNFVEMDLLTYQVRYQLISSNKSSETSNGFVECGSWLSSTKSEDN